MHAHPSIDTLLGVGASLLIHSTLIVAQAAAARPPQVLPLSPVQVEIVSEQFPVVEPTQSEHIPQALDQLARAQNLQRVPGGAPQTGRLPAKAGRTLTAALQASGTDRLADFTLMQGDGESYLGGVTANDGQTSSRGESLSPRSVQVADAAVHGAPTAAVTVDRSRTSRPISSDWSCSSLFPSDPAAGDSAQVVVIVSVRLDGQPISVHVVRDPGHGFGGAARTCAFQQKYLPALDRDGNPITAATGPITVQFIR